MTTPVPPTQTDVEVVQGGTFSMRVMWTDNQATPQPISLANYNAIMMIRSKRSRTAPLLATLDSSQTALHLEPGGLTGAIDVRLGADITGLMVKPTYYYDLFVVNNTDPTEATRLVVGSMTISPSVTVLP